MKKKVEKKIQGKFPFFDVIGILIYGPRSESLVMTRSAAQSNEKLIKSVFIWEWEKVMLTKQAS